MDEGAKGLPTKTCQGRGKGAITKGKRKGRPQWRERGGDYPSDRRHERWGERRKKGRPRPKGGGGDRQEPKWGDESY
ncbi:hypothetical protein AMTR_s00084p00112590 [Amborella trichopoda]|uniref:Uncharacterized protein n=1 Tax=Amborella trichopoda TaxID=13333 RepID=W1P3U3_AMBTC|nr:hypothetical protein AMTR_s00084p00112590 [Amborella trichopoda]